MTKPLAHLNPFRSHAARKDSETRLMSKATKLDSGPSQNEPTVVCSTWTIGWQTPTLIVGCYILAVVLALTHLILFRFLDGKEADGPLRVAPQAYITTASNVIANAFGAALKASLAVAFSQYLWHLFRVQTMKISTIELLFSIRSNPFQIFRKASLKATPTLCALALIMWISSIVISFPPGALTISTDTRTSYKVVNVPSFNASFMGNASGADANIFSLIGLSVDPIGQGGFESGDFLGGKDTNLINRLARQVLISGEALPMASPCGANCSYLVNFEAPYIECTNSSSIYEINYTSNRQMVIYTGQWTSPARANLVQSLYNGTYTLAHMNTTTLSPLSVNIVDYASNTTVQNKTTFLTVQSDNMVCSPGRANYTLNHTYINNVYSRNVSVKPIDRLINLALLTHNSIVIVPGFNLNNTLAYGTQPANWSTDALNYYRDNNHMAIFNSVMSWLVGSFNASLQPRNSDIGNPVTSILTNATFELAWEEFFSTNSNGVTNNTSVQGHTVIDSTRFNTIFNQYTNASNPLFNISADILNDYLLNMTTSIGVTFGRWDISANATVSTVVNVYSFSSPLNLLLPYFVTLILSVPFVVLGCTSMISNGVSATDGSFIQILTTSTGSSILDKAAAGGCLGGEESVPDELKDLKIRFGEFITRDEPGGIKRAGFGVEGEVKRLDKGHQYGVKRWI